MAQTKKKRKTKHRGNAAGMVEARGRTGRKPTEGEKGAAGSRSKPAKGELRPHRLDRPPTWKGAAFRAVVAAGTFFAVLVLFLKRPAQASAAIALMMILVYTPLGYWTDMWIHRRRLARKAKAAAEDSK